MANTAWTFDSAGLTPAYPLRATNWTVQTTVAGTGAVTCDVSVQASNDGVAFVELDTFSLSGTTSASDLASVQGGYKYARVEVEAITGTGAVATVSIHQSAA